jgi:peptidoglycan/LPS O-acetylase OafA/YrhL
MTTILEHTEAATPSVQPTSARPRRSFQPDIEGLRAIAVLAVVAFHAAVPFVGGGFVGVDVFFVISGYLITGQLVREVFTTGKISLPGFYARRARRILPSASIVILVVAVVSAILDPLLGLYHAAQDLLAAALYTTNWHFIDLGTNYLAQSTSESPVLHFWSLAVEEQFYLVWPLLILGAAFVARRRRLPGPLVVAVAIGVVTAASFVAGLMLTASDPKLAYMATQTRAWEFGVGAIIALGTTWMARRSATSGWSRLGWVLGWAGIASIVVAIFAFTGDTPFPGWAALLPTVGAAAIIAGGILTGTGGTSIGRILSLRPVRYLGRVSYAWYLWHWPVLVLVELRTGTLPWTTRCVLMLAALGLAVATLHLIETPIARWKSVAKQVAPALALGLLCMVLTSATALGIGSNAVNTMSASNSSVSAHTILGAFGGTASRTSGAVTPTALDASSDVPRPLGCLLDHQVGRVAACEIGPADGTRVVLFGDSHAEQWLPALQIMGAERKWRLTVFAKSGCPVANIAPREDGSRFSQPECAAWREASIKMITKDIKPAMIIVSSLDSYIPDAGEMLTAWNSSLDKLRTAGVPIAYLRDTPSPGRDIPTCISGALDDWAKCAFTPGNHPEPVIQQSILGNEQAVSVIDMYPYLCSSASCPAVRNGLLLYRDDSHITATAAKTLEPVLDAAFVKAGLIPKSTKSKSD